MPTCSMCFGTQKFRVGDDLYWCTKCTPRDYAGLLAGEDEELPTGKNFVPASSNRVFYKPPNNTLVFHTAEGLHAGQINTVVGNGSVSFANLDEPQEDPPQPPDPFQCSNCDSSEPMILVSTRESWEIYSGSVECIDGDWVIWADFHNAEPGDTIKPMELECTNCGIMSSIPESYSLEYR